MVCPESVGGTVPCLMELALFCSGILALQCLFCFQPGHAGSGVIAEKIKRCRVCSPTYMNREGPGIMAPIWEEQNGAYVFGGIDPDSFYP